MLTTAEEIVKVILEDLAGRIGISDAFDKIPTANRYEMYIELTKKVEVVLEKQNRRK